MMYVGVVKDRMNGYEIVARTTKRNSYFEAHEAADKLMKRKGLTGLRYELAVVDGGVN